MEILGSPGPHLDHVLWFSGREGGLGGEYRLNGFLKCTHFPEKPGVCPLPCFVTGLVVDSDVVSLISFFPDSPHQGYNRPVTLQLPTMERKCQGCPG